MLYQIRAYQLCFEFFGWHYPFYGGFGIALLRLMFIKYPLSIHCWYPKLIMWMLVVGCNAMALLQTILWISSLDEASAILYECFTASENGKSVDEIIKTFMIFLVLSAMIGEFAIYVTALRLVHASDLSMINYLSNQAMKKRT